MNTLTLASGLSDHDLLARIGVLAAKEREATVELVAHLAVLDARPALFAAQGYGSLFTYCTHVLGLSEDATCNRTKAARASRRFPVILDLLASGALSLTSVRLLSPCLTPRTIRPSSPGPSGRAGARSRRWWRSWPRDRMSRLPSGSCPRPAAAPTVRDGGRFVRGRCDAVEQCASVRRRRCWPHPNPLPPARRPVIEITSPERYRVQFTIGKESHDKLRRLQDLLRREIPDGDAGAIFDRAITLLLERVEKAKRGAAARPRPIRPGTDDLLRTPLPASRDIPRSVKRGASRRDRDQCGYVAPNGTRCTERTFLEFHHRQPYAQGGLATVENISLRCRRHNQYEAELIFGARRERGRTWSEVLLARNTARDTGMRLARPLLVMPCRPRPEAREVTPTCDRARSAPQSRHPAFDCTYQRRTRGRSGCRAAASPRRAPSKVSVIT